MVRVAALPQNNEAFVYGRANAPRYRPRYPRVGVCLPAFSNNLPSNNTKHIWAGSLYVFHTTMHQATFLLLFMAQL